jgi:hypothetical protein
VGEIGWTARSSERGPERMQPVALVSACAARERRVDDKTTSLKVLGPASV